MTDEVRDLLAEVEKEIENFETNKGNHEARNPQDQQKEINLYLEKRDALVEDYKKKYPALLDAWKLQNERIKERWSIIKCITSYAHSVDHIKNVIDCQNALTQEIRTQQNNLIGEVSPSSLSTLLETAKKDNEVARQRYKTLTLISQAISARLAEIDKWIQQIDELIPGENQSFAIYLFWCKVIPAHRDLSKVQDASCSFIDEFKKRRLYVPPSNPRAMPWLIPHDQSSAELDCAFLAAFKTTREAEVKARIEFDSAKTTLDSLLKAQKEWADKADEKVKSALQGKHKCPAKTSSNSCTPQAQDQIP